MKHVQKSYRALFTGVLASCVGISLLAMPLATAVESFGVGARPANPQADNPRTQSIFVYELKRGDVFEDAVRVINNTDKEKEISITAIDSIASSDGAFACAQAVDDKKDVGSWITLSKSEVTLAAGGEEKVPFTVRVPDNADVGEHNGCIAIQDMSRTQKAGKGIVVSFRSALRVAVTIPGKVVEKLEFTGLEVVLKDKAVVVSPMLKNDGNVSVDTTLRIGLQPLWGAGGKTNDGEFPILAHTGSRFNFEFERPFWGGWYRVNAGADYKLLSDPKRAPKPLGGPSQTIFIAPQKAALLIELAIVGALVGAAVYLGYRWRSRRALKQNTINYTVRAGDDIENVAQRAHVRWQVLAKLNHLKPPYRLEPGQRLQIPHKRKR